MEPTPFLDKIIEVPLPGLSPGGGFQSKRGVTAEDQALGAVVQEFRQFDHFKEPSGPS